MGSKFKLLKTCHHCGGTGEVPIYSSPNAPPQGTMICPECEGNGKILIGKVDHSDVMDKLGDVLDKCNDIFEKLNE